MERITEPTSIIAANATSVIVATATILIAATATRPPIECITTGNVTDPEND